MNLGSSKLPPASHRALLFALDHGIDYRLVARVESHGPRIVPA